MIKLEKKEMTNHISREGIRGGDVGATHYGLKYVNKSADVIFDMPLKSLNSESFEQAQKLVLK